MDLKQITEDHGERTKLLRRCLGEAIGPLGVDDEKMYRISQGLLAGQSESHIGLESVPISVVYSAMLIFEKKASILKSRPRS